MRRGAGGDYRVDESCRKLLVDESGTWVRKTADWYPHQVPIECGVFLRPDYVMSGVECALMLRKCHLKRLVLKQWT